MLDKDYGNVLTVGRQEFMLNGFSNLRGFVDDYLLSCGAKSVTSIDFDDYEGSNLTIDLSLRFKNLQKLQFDTILDFGSLEHISNPLIALENIFNLLAPKGKILHCNPANGSLGHGFYQFSPEFFQNAYRYCGAAKTVTYLVNRNRPKVFWLVAEVPEGARVNIRKNKNNIYNCVYVEKSISNKKISHINFQQRDYIKRWKNNSLPPKIWLKGIKNRYWLSRVKGMLIDSLNMKKSKLNKHNPYLTKVIIS